MQDLTETIKRSLHSRLIERIKTVTPPNIGDWADVIADELLNDGWIRLPCKGEARVYFVDRNNCNQMCPYNTSWGCIVVEKNGTCPLENLNKM